MTSFALQMTWLIGLARYKLDKATIVNDLSKERPQWILSAYGAGREAPIQLFGGLPREQSFEELRVRHYELLAQGRQQEVIQEAQSLVSNAEQQIQTALKDVDGAIKYVINGEHEHPNRIDAVNAKGVLPTEAQMSGQAQQPALAFGQSFSIAPTFGQPSAPPAFGRPSAPSFGQPSAPASTLGQPSVSGFGQSPAFGQSATLGRPTTSFGQSASAFGKPLAPTQTFGQSSTPLPFGAQQQKPSPFGSLAGPSTITLPPSAANQPNNPFGQLPGAAQPSPFGQLSAPSQTNVFGRPSAPSSTNPFNRSAISGIATSIAPPNTFSQPSGPVPTADSGHPPAAASTITSQSSKTCISYVNRVVPNFGFSLESLISSQTSFYSADIPKAQTASGPISRPAATGPTSVQALTSVPAAEGSSAKISNWKGKPVSYIGDEPCFKSNGDWQRIWFSHGPPVFSKTPGLPEEVYTSSLKNEYGFAEENGVFKNGIMPEVPPKREWCNWDF